MIDDGTAVVFDKLKDNEKLNVLEKANEFKSNGSRYDYSLGRSRYVLFKESDNMFEKLILLISRY